MAAGMRALLLTLALALGTFVVAPVAEEASADSLCLHRDPYGAWRFTCTPNADPNCPLRDNGRPVCHS